MAIYFYKVEEVPYGCFSNFSAHSFALDGEEWRTSEHYFQAQKFLGTPYLVQVQQALTPRAAANMGRNREWPLRSDWETVKDDIMRRAVLTKFSVHDDIRAILLGTGGEEIVEKTSDDYYWGCGTNGTGKNMLGRILVEVREILRQQ